MKLTPVDPLQGELFGASVALDGMVAVVGASRDNSPITNTGQYGAAHVFRFAGGAWIEEAKLTAPQRDLLDWFGWSVAVDGDVVLVGTRHDEDVAPAAGAVYVFRHDGNEWGEEGKWTASDGVSGDAFGRSLAIERDLAVAGAPEHSMTAPNDGAVYVFRYGGGAWNGEAKLTASDAAASAFFGDAIAVSGSRILIGALGDSPPGAGQNAGAAYVFEYDDGHWVETAKLTAPDPGPQASFGRSVALDGDRVLIGAPLDDELGGGAGAVYAFSYDGAAWSFGGQLLASDHTGFNLFGTSVDMDGGRAAVGAENWFPEGEDATGKAYLYEIDTATGEWQEQAGFVSGDGGSGDQFGSAVALSGEVISIGAPEHDRPAPGAGAAYIYGEPVGSSMSTERHETVERARLSSAYPNPFRQQAFLTLTLPHSERVLVSLYDILGRRVRVLHDGWWPGRTARLVTVSAADLAGGVYMVRVDGPSYVESRTLTLIR